MPNKTDYDKFIKEFQKQLQDRYDFWMETLTKEKEKSQKYKIACHKCAELLFWEDAFIRLKEKYKLED